MKPCSSAGCSNPTYDRGWCDKHSRGAVKVPLSWVVPEKREMVLAQQREFDRILAKLKAKPE